MSCLQAVAAVDQVPEDSEARKSWQETRISEIASFKALPPDQGISRLGDLIGQLTRPLVYRDAKEKDEVVQAARAALIDIPGHAEYYTSRIKDERDLYDKYQNENDSRADKAGIDLLNSERYGFETLGQLPSAETVRVLGDLLDDSRGSFSPDSDVSIEDRQSEIPINGAALDALMKLPIRSKPFQNTGPVKTAEEGLQRWNAWKKWYLEIKEGKRTLQFLGDECEYNLNGPVAPAAGLDKAPTSNSAADALASAPSKPSHLPLIGLGVAVCALLGGGWLAFRPKKLA